MRERYEDDLKILCKIAQEDRLKEAIQKGVSDNYFPSYLDEWQFLKTYYRNYKKLTIEVLRDKIPNLPATEEIQNYDLDFLINKLRNFLLKQQFTTMLQNTATDLSRKVPIKQTIDKLNANIRQLNLGFGYDVNITKDAMERFKELERRQERVQNQGLIGITAGIDVLDNYTGGVLEGDLWVIVGRTGMGKSWLMLKMATEAWKQGYNPLLVNLEMGAYEVGFRMDTLISKKFSNVELTQGRIDGLCTADYKSFIENELIPANNFWLVRRTRDSINFTLSDLESKIIEYEPDIVYIDYLNLLSTTQKFRSIWEKVTYLTRDLKAIARNNCPIVVVVQAGRGAAGKSSYLPQVHEIANSDSVGRDSDKIVSIVKMHNEEDNMDYMKCALIKNRGGKEIGEFWLYWDIDKGIIYSVPSIKQGTLNLKW